MVSRRSPAELTNTCKESLSNLSYARWSLLLVVLRLGRSYGKGQLAVLLHGLPAARASD